MQEDSALQGSEDSDKKALAAVVLAAGEGKRLKSRHPKPLQPLCGRPLIDHVLDAVAALEPAETVVIVGVGREEVTAAVEGRGGLKFAVQERQLGTGDAAKAAARALEGFSGDVLITCADTPLVTAETLQGLLDCHHANEAAGTVLTAIFDDPTGYGRIVRGDKGLVLAITEQKDASEQVRAIREINAGIYVFDAEALFAALERLRPDNEQAEYYLTDVIGLLVSDGRRVAALAAPSAEEVVGINNRVQLSEAERIARGRIRTRVMLDGTTLMDPATTLIDAEVTIGRDTVIWPGATLLGNTQIGDECEIGPNVFIRDSRIANGAKIRQASMITDSAIGERASVGPFSHVREHSTTEAESRVGSYTEVVRSRIGARTKAQHFTYLGDADVGEDVNIGAGVVTCNYDGEKKHKTIIGDEAFIGSDAIIVAPGEIGPRSYVAAGSVITKPVPEGALGIGRTSQANREGWGTARRKRRESEEGV